MLLVCLAVRLCANKHPLECFYLCNFVSERRVKDGGKAEQKSRGVLKGSGNGSLKCCKHKVI